jgi:hypothetical protein
VDQSRCELTSLPVAVQLHLDFLPMSISISAQYVILQKYSSHPRLVIYFFPTLPIKLKIGLQVGGSLIIAKHLVNQKQGEQSHHFYYTFLWQVFNFAMPFTSLSKVCKNAGPKPFC